MRFCPFCAHENEDAAAECRGCGRRLPAARKPEADTSPDAAPPILEASGVARIKAAGSRPPGLAPKQPLRARIEALMASRAEEATGSGPVPVGGPRTLGGVNP